MDRRRRDDDVYEDFGKLRHLLYVILGTQPVCTENEIMHACRYLSKCRMYLEILKLFADSRLDFILWSHNL